MLTIGAPRRKWTLLLLLAGHVQDSAATRAANETAIVAAPSESTAVQHASAIASSSILSSHKYADTEIVCLFRTINYITHTLPQQCAKTSWSAPAEVVPTNGSAAEAEATPRLSISTPEAGAGSSAEEEKGSASLSAPQAEETGSSESVSDSGTASTIAEVELETDSPFDNANFLSFEEWKKKNLAQVGQSPENVGQRAAPSNQAARRRPVNVNALDSLGDEGEIEIDFSGFGTPAEDSNVASRIQHDSHDEGATKASDGEGKVAPSSWALSKDAGKTCKERFNYASFDCAATVLKANKQAKSSSSILVENKDSYMLNECSANNKFLIVELCDDILVDTVVLANYEFFSSMFRHFRVSVSDRYPVKMERWRVLGTFEARNSRDIQPFLITEPQIWARYLRVEFLSQYGNEFYCPLSLLRVHGTTMMEQFRREEEEARGVDDDEELHEAVQTDLVKPAEDSGPLPPDQVPIQPMKDDSIHSAGTTIPESATKSKDPAASDGDSAQLAQQSGTTEPTVSHTTAATPPSQSTNAPKSDGSDASSVSSPANVTPSTVNEMANVTAAGNGKPSEAPSSTEKGEPSSQSQSTVSEVSVITQSPIASRNDSTNNVVSNAASSSSSSLPSKPSSNSTVSNSPSPQSRSSPTQPNPATPSTQESFFKSIHKRLLHLEANSTLSLQYIEEQSRILRDAFIKVEKRQLAKTEKFLDHLNSTVMLELKSYRSMYEQLWQSTIIELEGMKERQRAEMGEIGQRLGVLAEELVWQKRMAVVQSTLLLLCLGLVLFVRSGTLSSNTEIPIVQQLGSKYTSFFETSPPRSPEPANLMHHHRRRTFRNMWRSDTSVGLSDRNLSDAETPDSPRPHPTAAEQAERVRVLETQSGPATPNGTRDVRPSWEEVDRAMDQLNAEVNGVNGSSKGNASVNGENAAPGGSGVGGASGGGSRAKKKKERKSLLRRAHSNFENESPGPVLGDDEPADDSGEGLFVD